jgi:biotin carboxylase
MEEMGSKVRAVANMTKAGVPNDAGTTIPWCPSSNADFEFAQEHATPGWR